MGEKIKITTPENVELEFELAGLGSRLMAFLIDALIQGGILLGLFFLAGILSIRVETNPSKLSSWSLAILWVLVFVVVWGYYVYFEIRWNGQTPGKRKMNLRVIRDSGHPIDVPAAVLRNIVRIADYFFALGFVVLFISPQSRRLGDYVAGTLVVKIRNEEDLIEVPSSRGLFSRPMEYQLLDDLALSRIGNLDRQDYEAIRRFLERSSHLDSGLTGDLARQLAQPIMEHLAIPSPKFSFGYRYEQFLKEVAYAYEKCKGQ
jgi:uncharacterized RDD family membrane protein YckC